MSGEEHPIDVLTRRLKPELVRDTERESAGEGMLPDPENGYVAYARPANKPVYALHCILGKDGYRSFQYVHLDSSSRFAVEGKSQVIRLQFCGSKTIAVTIRGRNLWKLYDYIHQHRIPFVMRVEDGRDFAANDEPVVTAIEFSEVTEFVASQSGP